MRRRPDGFRMFVAAVAMAGAMSVFAGARLEVGARSQPEHVTTVCPSQGTHADSLAVIAAVAIPPDGLLLGKSEVSLRLVAPQDHATAGRLASAARDQTQTVLLQLRCVAAERPPHASWEVYVGLPAGAKPHADSPYFVGNVALFGDGIKSQSGRGSFAEFVFPLDRAIAASPGASALTLTFVPSSGIVVGGRPAPAEVAAPVRIGAANLLLEGPPGRQ